MMATERPKTTEEEPRPRCRCGSKTENPCWREATERAFAEDPEPDVCPEHYRLIQLGYKLDEYRDALYSARGWIVKEVDSECETPLMEHAYEMRERLEEDYWRVAIENRAAAIIANAGPSEHISPEAAAKFAEVQLRADALANARGLLEGAPEDFFGHADRWEMVAGLAVAVEAVNEEHERCKREMRL